MEKVLCPIVFMLLLWHSALVIHVRTLTLSGLDSPALLFVLDGHDQVILKAWVIFNKVYDYFLIFFMGYFIFWRHGFLIFCL